MRSFIIGLLVSLCIVSSGAIPMLPQKHTILVDRHHQRRLEQLLPPRHVRGDPKKRADGDHKFLPTQTINGEANVPVLEERHASPGDYRSKWPRLVDPASD